MPGKVVCVRFRDEELARLCTLERELGTRTSSTIRIAVSMALMQVMVDKEGLMRYDQDDSPGPPTESLTRPGSDNPTPRAFSPSGGRSEPGAEPPPSVPGLPALDPEDDEVDRPSCGLRQLVPFSKSQMRRLAAQKGEPAPEFGPSAEFDTPITLKTVDYTIERTQEPFFNEPSSSFTVADRNDIPTAVPAPFGRVGPETPIPAPPKNTSDMTADELDAWVDKVMKGTP